MPELTHTTLRALADNSDGYPWKEKIDTHADAWQADRTMLDGAGKTNDELWERIAAAKAREEKVRNTAGLLASLLRQAEAFKGYGNGPLTQPAVRMVLREWESLVASEPPGEEGT